MLRVLKQYYPVRNVIFVIGEGLFIYASVLAASWITYGSDPFVLDSWLSLKALLITLVCQACLYYNDLYDLNVANRFSELGIRLLESLGFAAIFLAGIYVVFPRAIIGQGIFIITVFLVILLIFLWRFGYALVLSKGLFNQKIILLGSGNLARNIMAEIGARMDCGYTVAAIAPEKKEHAAELNLLQETSIIETGEERRLCDASARLSIQKIVVALDEKRGAFPTEELLKCRVEGVEVLEGNSFYEMLTGKLIVAQINPGWLIFSEGFQKSRSQRFFKRMTDLVMSLVMLISLSPLIVLTAILIKIDSRGPVLFSQDRVGEKRKPYRMYKFRSMVTDAEKHSGPVWAQTNDARVTRVGKFIRKWRVDELPQLWNVLKGDMSFVGPRPEREHFVKELEMEIPYYAERFSVKPGITGWAQVSYGYGASVEDAIEKLNYDLFYIKNLSIFMDLVIILRTIKTVLFGKGAR